MEEFPKKITVKKLIEGRYPKKSKPTLWDNRQAGLDIIEDQSGRQYTLESEGSQSSPDEGWQLMLTQVGESTGSYRWTLYGIAR